MSRAETVTQAIVMDNNGGLKVRRTTLDSAGYVIRKHGLSYVTGEWVEVTEGALYPSDCIWPSRFAGDRFPGIVTYGDFDETINTTKQEATCQDANVVPEE